MKKAVLFGAAGILVCAALVVMGTYLGEAKAAGGGEKSTLEKKVEKLKKKDSPIPCTECPQFYPFLGPNGYGKKTDCETAMDGDCAGEWPSGMCNTTECDQRYNPEGCLVPSLATAIRCYQPEGDQWYPDCLCHCWEDLK